MNIIFLVVYIIWFLSEILLNRLLRSKSTDKQNADKHSLSLIWITVIVTIAIAVFIAPKVPFYMYTNPAFQYVGIAVILIGVLLRLAAVASLGKYFTVDVTIRRNHRLQTNGLYSIVRHPSYFASLLSFIGFGISLNNWLSLLLIVAAVLVVFMNRIKIEEKVLIEQFGDEYLQYKKRTKRLIPFVY